jgi:hypothetical protein
MISTVLWTTPRLVCPLLPRPFQPRQAIDEPLDFIAGFSQFGYGPAVLAGRGRQRA